MVIYAPVLTCAAGVMRRLTVSVPVQIDLRFTNPEQGSLAVVVAPVLRFIDVGFNADIRIEELGTPDRLISGFAPELFGSPLQVLTALHELGFTACNCSAGTPPGATVVFQKEHCAVRYIFFD